MTGARTDLTSPIPDPEDQKILELRKMGLLPQVDTNNDNPNTNNNQEETIMATEMTKDEMEKKLAEIKAAAGEKADKGLYKVKENGRNNYTIMSE